MLVVRKGAGAILADIGKTVEDLYAEQNALKPDTKVWEPICLISHPH